MLLATKFMVTLAIGLSCLLFVSGEVNCNSNIDRTYTVGASRGLWFCAMRINEGLFVTGIKLWSEKTSNNWELRLKGIEVTYSNGEKTMIGVQDAWSQQINWNPTDVSVSYAGGKNGGVSGHHELLGTIAVKLSDGQLLCRGSGIPGLICADWDHTGEHSDGTDGVLLGISGKYGQWNLEEITYHMLSTKATAARIHDVVFSPSLEELNRRQNNEQVQITSYEQTRLFANVLVGIEVSIIRALKLPIT
jgi:hypothetical protein